MIGTAGSRGTLLTPAATLLSVLLLAVADLKVSSLPFSLLLVAEAPSLKHTQTAASTNERFLIQPFEKYSLKKEYIFSHGPWC